MTSAESGKSSWRSRLIAARRERSEADRAAAARANGAHLLAALTGAGTVAGYLPLPSEPLRTDLLDQLSARGTRVLVPITRASQPLDWAAYPGPTTPGAFGIAEPTGPALGPDAIATADVILVPALAVDRTGVRLGRGGGHYDRSLALRPSGLLIAVLFDGEVVPTLPSDPHDVPVHAVVTPGGGVAEFARTG